MLGMIGKGSKRGEWTLDARHSPPAEVENHGAHTRSADINCDDERTLEAVSEFRARLAGPI
jgi:hypothetical protein